MVWEGGARLLLRIPVAAIVGVLRVTRTIVVLPFGYFVADLYPEVKWWLGRMLLIFSTSLLGN
jgi:hypothetical protein